MSGRLLIGLWMLAAVVNAGIADEAGVKSDPCDPERVLVTVDGEALRAWQVETLLENQVGQGHEVRAVKFWIDVQAQAAEARRRGLDEEREAAFILDFYRDYYLTRLLAREVEKSLLVDDEEELRAHYEEHKDKYKVPLRANIQHIMLRSKLRAEEVAELARAEGADFGKLVREHSQAGDEERKGMMRGTAESLTQRLGSEVVEAIAAAAEGDILGPLAGGRGYEIVRVIDLLPARQMSFEEVKESIARELTAQAVRTELQGKLKEITQEAEVVASPEWERMQEEEPTQRAVEEN